VWLPKAGVAHICLVFDQRSPRNYQCAQYALKVGLIHQQLLNSLAGTFCAEFVQLAAAGLAMVTALCVDIATSWIPNAWLNAAQSGASNMQAGVRERALVPPGKSSQSETQPSRRASQKRHGSGQQVISWLQKSASFHWSDARSELGNSPQHVDLLEINWLALRPITCIVFSLMKL